MLQKATLEHVYILLENGCYVTGQLAKKLWGGNRGGGLKDHLVTWSI